MRGGRRLGRRAALVGGAVAAAAAAGVAAWTPDRGGDEPAPPRSSRVATTRDVPRSLRESLDLLGIELVRLRAGDRRRAITEGEAVDAAEANSYALGSNGRTAYLVRARNRHADEAEIYAGRAGSRGARYRLVWLVAGPDADAPGSTRLVVVDAVTGGYLYTAGVPFG